jgi:hypothetical protein
MSAVNFFSKKYGDQDIYNQGEQEAIDGLLQKMSHPGPDLTAIFFECLEFCGSIRAKIAKLQNCEDQEHFGVKRKTGQPCCFTTLSSPDPNNPYHSASVAILRIIRDHIPDLFTQRSIQVFEKKPNQFKQIDFPYESSDNVQIRSRLNYRFLYHQEIKKIKEQINQILKQRSDLSTKQIYVHLRKNNLEAYKNIRLLEIIPNRSECLPMNGKQPILHIISRLELEPGKMCALSHYFSQIDSFLPDGSNCMTTPFLVVHQDPYLFEDTLKAVSQIFARVMNWKHRAGVNELKDFVGRIRYILAHVAPFGRGSAAICEWIETALYWHHGFTDFQSPKNRDLKAISSMSLDRFMEYYHKNTKIQSG